MKKKGFMNVVIDIKCHYMKEKVTWAIVTSTMLGWSVQITSFQYLSDVLDVVHIYIND